MQTPEYCPQFTLLKDRRYSQFISKPVYEHVTSSFTLNQDIRSVPDDGSRSQSAAEYRRWSEYRPSDAAKPRPPASIFHEDARNLEDVQSESLRHYRPHPREPRPVEDFYSKYFATTYKRDADPRFKVCSAIRTLHDGPKKLHLFFNVITLSTLNQFSLFWHICTTGNLQPDDVAHLTWFV